MEYSIELIIAGFVMLAAGALGIAAYARFERRPHEVNNEDVLIVSLVCVLLTGLNGGGIIAVVNGAFAFDLAARLGLIVGSVAASAALVYLFWHMLGVHRLGYSVKSQEIGNAALDSDHANQNRDRVKAA